MVRLLDALRARSNELVTDLADLVAVESPSDDLAATARSAAAVAELGDHLLGVRPEQLDVDGRAHLQWTFGEPRVLLLGHHDTVWPIGTTARWSFGVADGRATGPGAFDMKAGIVQGLHACSLLDDLDGVRIVLTADEELGSPTSRELVEDAARGLDAVLVLEPSAGGAVKTGRKGVSMYRVTAHGRAAHAGLDPERGVNALVELAHLVPAVAALADPELGTTVTPTTATAGSTTNTVPAVASFTVDARTTSTAEQDRLDDAMQALVATTPESRLEVEGGPNRPPLEHRHAADLFARAQRLADRIGLAPLAEVEVGGASDGNFTAGLGIPTLDGLGAVGDGAHAEGEHVVVAAMAERAALVGALLADLLKN